MSKKQNQRAAASKRAAQTTPTNESGTITIRIAHQDQWRMLATLAAFHGTSPTGAAAAILGQELDSFIEAVESVQALDI